MNKYQLFIDACKGAARVGGLIYLYGRGQFSSARGAYNFCKRTGDVFGEHAIYNCVVNYLGRKVY